LIVPGLGLQLIVCRFPLFQDISLRESWRPNQSYTGRQGYLLMLEDWCHEKRRECNMTEDTTLIAELKQGNPAALEYVYVKYRPKLMATACSYRVESHHAEDILHDVFVSFLDRIDKCEITHSLYGYLRVGILNAIRDMIRRRKRQETRLALTAVSKCVPHSPYEHCIRLEETLRAEKLLRVLPDSQREVVCMRIRQGLKFEEIAQVQGVSSSTARGRYRYGISRLQGLTAIHNLD